MSKTIRVLIMLVLACWPSMATDVLLSWDANTEPDLAGYRIYEGTTTSVYTNHITLGTQTSHVLSGLSQGQHFFALTAYDTSGNESGFSNEVAALVLTTPPPQGGETITMGETAIVASNDSGNGNMILAQRATLSQAGTCCTLYFYTNNSVGQLRLAVYDATGAGGGPGQLKAQTAAFTPLAASWNASPVISQVSLPASTYWLAYMPSSSSLTFRIDRSSGTAKYFPFTFGPMPATFSTTPSTGAFHWSLYASVITIPAVPAPTVSISSGPSTITAGQSSTLTWTSTDATSASINVGIGAVATSGSIQVHPAETTTYTITVTGTGGTASANATITVNPPLPVVDVNAPIGVCVRVNGVLVNCP